MSKTKTLKNILDVAPVVTSFSDSDSIIGISNGILKKGSPETFKNFVSKNLGVQEDGTWLRVLEFMGCCSGLVSVGASWGSSAPRTILIAYAIHTLAIGQASTSNVGRLWGGTAQFSKARVVYTLAGVTGNAYLEVLNSQKNSIFIVDAFGASWAKAMCEIGSIPEGYAAKEFDLSTPIYGGGVNTNRSISYAILQKGGLRDGYERTYQHPAEKQDDGRDGGKKLCHGHRFTDRRWVLDNRLTFHFREWNANYKRNPGGLSKSGRSLTKGDSIGFAKYDTSAILFCCFSYLESMVQIHRNRGNLTERRAAA